MHWFVRVACIAASISVLSYSQPALAQYVGTTTPLFPTLMVPMFPSGMIDPVPVESRSGSGETHSAAARSAPATTILPRGAPQIDVNASELATHFAPTARARMKAVYLQSYDAFLKLHSKLGLADGDVANAISAYIAGNYMVLHQVGIDDPVYLKLVSQIRSGLQHNPGFLKVPTPRKRKLYEQTAMVGTFMAMARMSQGTVPQDQAVVRNLRDSAKANLEMALGGAAATLRIDAGGMHF